MNTATEKPASTTEANAQTAPRLLSDKESLLVIADNFEGFWSDGYICQDQIVRECLRDDAARLREIAAKLP